MKEIPVPASGEEQQKVSKSCKRMCTLFSVLFYISLAVSVAGLIGVIVCIFVFELQEGLPMTLFYILVGSFAGGGALFGGAAYLTSRLLSKHDEARLDYMERCDSPVSFYVGEGTLATFGDSALILHGEGEGGKRVNIPYGEIRFFSVCTRTLPREKGEWSVVIELPAHYIAKNPATDKREKVLVQTDAKERLKAALAARSLPLLGEEPGPQSQNKSKFKPKAKYYVPETAKRRRSIIFAIVGALAAVAGVPLAIYYNITVGCLCSVIGLFLAGRFFFSFLGAKSEFCVYDEGIWWKDANGADRIFLKWEEIESVSRDCVQNVHVLKIQCTYGAYHLPDIAGAFEYLQEIHPEKCREEV